MGTCLSKKKLSSSSSSSSSSPSSVNKNVVPSSTQASVVVVPVPVDPNTSNRSKHEKQQEQHQQLHEEEKQEEPTQVKKEIFLIKHRKSHDDRDRNAAKNPLAPQNQPPPVEDSESAPAPAPAVVRTSSCTKEEVDAILIQCGRLSRSSSGKAASSSSASRTRKYSGSKRSYDFDNNLVDDDDDIVNDDGAAAMEEKRPRERQRSHRRSSSRGSPSPQERRRRTPSRERDSSNNKNQQRSSSRERRVSRSPGRRCPTESAAPSSTNSGRPGKMVSVPATVSSSLVMDKGNNLDSAANANAIKRISVKRNVGEAGSRSAASPRSQSPARGNGSAKSTNEQQQQQPSLSRNSSRKAEQSPYRRNPLSEIDPNSLAYPNSHNNNSNNSRAQTKSKREISVTEGDDKELPTQAQKPNAGTNYRSSSRVSAESKNSQPQQAMVETTVVISGADNKSQQTLTRSRSSRRSRDLDINPEILLNPTPTPSYTRLLLEDIQNFHQKNTTNPNNTTTVVSLPPCVSKACSILEAVADLNSATGSNLSCSAFAEDQLNKGANNTYSSLLGPAKEPFLQSEVIVGCDDLTEPSFHKYVTVRRGGGGSSELVVDSEDQESSGSNSFVGGSQIQNWGLSSSSWEPNSAESTDSWNSRSNMREEERLSGRKRDSYSAQPQHSGGIGRGRLGSAKGLHTASVVAAAFS